MALRLSVKQHEQEISRLRNTLKFQQKSFKQVTEIVTALEKALFLKDKLKEYVKAGKTSSNNVAASVSFFEVGVTMTNYYYCSQ